MMSILFAMRLTARSKQVRKHRFAAESSYARGTQTRDRLIDSALKLFSLRGFDGASTREIAAAAGMNAPALQYYFDNKQGLYDACGEQIGAEVWTRIGATVMHAERLLAAGADDAELIEACCDIQVTTAGFLSSVSKDWFLWIARDQTGVGRGPGSPRRPPHRHSERLVRVSAAIIARLSGLKARNPECLVRAMCLNGQLLYFHFLRRKALATLHWKRIDAGQLDLLKRVTRAHTIALLQALCAHRPVQATPVVPLPAPPPRGRKAPQARRRKTPRSPGDGR
jgi:AcrR family transcriptional regulator